MFASTFDSIKNFSFSGLFTTKPYTPTGIHANPSALIDALEASFKARFGASPDLDNLRTITPRQAYAGGENVFVYAHRRAQVHIGLTFDELKEFFKDASITGTVLILSLPATISDEFSKVVMGFAVPLNYAYYAGKHLDLDVGKFAAKVTAQLHGSKLAMKQFNRRLDTAAARNKGFKILHTKQIVLASGYVLTAQLDSRGTVALFHSFGDADNVTVVWDQTRDAVKVVDGKWSEDLFNSAFVQLVAKVRPDAVEEIAHAALNSMPLTKESVIDRFAGKSKNAKDEATAAANAEAKADVKADPVPQAAPAEAAVQPKETVQPEADVTMVADVADVQAPATPVVEPEAKSTVVDGETHVSVDMGELKGEPVAKAADGSRMNKQCGDQNAIRLVRKVIGKKAIHMTKEIYDAAPQGVNTVVFLTDTNTLKVKGKTIAYDIICVDGGSTKPVFRLECSDLKELGEMIGYDFGHHTQFFCITNAALANRLLGNGNTHDPVCFSK